MLCCGMREVLSREVAIIMVLNILLVPTLRAPPVLAKYFFGCPSAEVPLKYTLLKIWCNTVSVHLLCPLWSSCPHAI